MTMAAAGDDMARGERHHAARTRPAARPPRRLRCVECGGAFETLRLDAKFCTDACRHTAGNREKARGVAAARALIDYRRHRGKGETSRTDLTNLGDKWVAEDNARERARQARIAAEREVEAGRVELDHPERLTIVGTAGRRLGTIWLDRSRNLLGWRRDSAVLGSTAWLAPSPAAALGTDPRTGRPRASDPHIRLFPAGQEPPEIDTRGR